MKASWRWDRTTGQAKSIINGYSDPVSTVVFSPDGSKSASGSGDRTVRVWDVVTGQAESMFEGHSGLVSTVVFSPDGSKLDSSQQETTDRSKSHSFYPVDVFLPHNHRPG